MSSCCLLSILVLAGFQNEGDAEAAADLERLRAAKIATDGPAMLDYFRARTLSPADAKKLAGLIQMLGEDSFAIREKASAALIRAGRSAIPLLKDALKSPDPEIGLRADRCLKRIEQGEEPATLAAAARVLGRLKPAGATQVLLAYAPFIQDETGAEGVQHALIQLAMTDGKPDADLARAVADRHPRVRGLAIVALLKASPPRERLAFQKHLEDADASVRLRVAMTFVDLKHKEGLPVLIRLLAELPRADVSSVEELLYQIAGEQAPKDALDGKAKPAKIRDAWLAWYKQHGVKLDLTRVSAEPRTLGYTLVAVIRSAVKAKALKGSVFELGADGKIRWQINDVDYPFDVQMVGPDRVLIADQRTNLVSERFTNGKVIWSKQISMPIACQRLPNGHTFIAGRTQLLIVDRRGNEVVAYKPPFPVIQGARRLRDGRMIVLNTQGDTAILDKDGNVAKRFHTDRVSAVGCVLDALPNGGFLIPHYTARKVVEYDAQGNRVKEHAVANPVSAMRLPNGHTLVATTLPRKIIELNRDGQEVWSYTADASTRCARRR